jgi:hypothetical protein
MNSNRDKILSTPDPMHSETDHVFIIGENDIIRVEERKSRDKSICYLVRFKNAAPTAELVQGAIDIMRIFRDIEWDFQLLCDMRSAQLMSQLVYSPTYYKLIGLIKNPHCRRCYVYVRPLPVIFGPIFTSTISEIVGALGVPCNIVETIQAPLRLNNNCAEQSIS